MIKSITEISSELKMTEYEGLNTFIEKYRDDQRSGVERLVNSANKKLSFFQEEIKRLESLRKYEREYDYCSYICGIDEAGRGPLAGPVVAAAVVLPKDCSILYVNDSKKLSEKRREMLYDDICKNAVSFGIGCVSHEIIDKINILQATYEAMRIAISKLNVSPEVLLNDAVRIPGVNTPQIPIIKGDAKSISIASASILAKVTRDRMMRVYDEMYPEYSFAVNKGYGTKQHIEAIRKFGPSDIHRNTFIKNFITE